MHLAYIACLLRNRSLVGPACGFAVARPARVRQSVPYRRSKRLPVESLEPWLTPAILIAGFAFLWSQLDRVRRDVGELRERMARLEGLFEGFTKRETG